MRPVGIKIADMILIQNQFQSNRIVRVFGVGLRLLFVCRVGRRSSATLSL